MRHRNPNGRRRIAAAAAVALAVALGTVAGGTSACAQSAAEDEEVPLDTKLMRQFLKDLGLRRDGEGIDYRERAPLVVPPSRNLPPPSDQPAPTAEWPKNSPRAIKHARTRGEVVPDTAVQNPNPPFQKKPWYNPAGWFSKEEYASFNGEPVRRDLTEPPAGYRVPSAEQPYGVSPDKKAGTPLATPSGLAPVGGQSGK